MTQGGTQRELPIAQVEQSDAAYLAAVTDCRLPRAVAAVLRWIIEHGRRLGGAMVVERMTQRQWSGALGLSGSSLSVALSRLRDSRLLSMGADGEVRLDLRRLVAVSEEARARAGPDDGAFDPAEALRTIASDRSRSALIGSDRHRSAGRARSVRTRNKSPVSVDAQESAEIAGEDGTGAADQTDRNRSSRSLANDPAWRALQTRHFRPELDRKMLDRAFAAAVAAGLVDDSHEGRGFFLATAYDLAVDAPRAGRQGGIRSPAVCLRIRVEQQRLWRISEEARRWVREVLCPPELRRRAKPPPDDNELARRRDELVESLTKRMEDSR
jgi:DNA-binding transcriptional ArsR family regulator